MYVCTHVHTYVRTYVSIYHYVCICMCIHVYVCVCVCMRMCMYVYVCLHMYFCVCRCVCIYDFYVYVLVIVCQCMQLHAIAAFESLACMYMMCTAVFVFGLQAYVCIGLPTYSSLNEVWRGRVDGRGLECGTDHSPAALLH